MKKEKAIEVLNSLITINNDRIEGYEKASKEIKELNLKNMFSEFISNSRKCKQELVMEVKTLGGVEANGTKNSGKVFRIWMDVKSELTSKNRKTILNSCVFGEEMALDTYDKALQNIILAHKSLLKTDYDYVLGLRDSLLDV